MIYPVSICLLSGVLCLLHRLFKCYCLFNGIKNLIPEWNQNDKIKVEFELTNGKNVTRELALGQKAKESMISFSSEVVKPSAEKSDVVYSFVDARKETALLVIPSMERYREISEQWFAEGMEAAREYSEIAYSYFNKTDPPSDQVDLLKGIPSATEAFVKLVNDIKINKTKNLIVDLRDNTGGNGLMVDMLIYFLSGKEGLINKNQGYQIIKYSDLYFMNYSSDSLALINKGLKIPLTMNDYNFSDENIYRKHATDISLFEKDFQKSPSFWDVYQTHQFDKPQVKLAKIIVLCSPITTSSGFNILTALYDKGAIIIGTASAQPGNNFGDIVFFQLKNSKLRGYVSFKQIITYPDDPIKGNCLMPDFPLAYEKCASLNFDPESEVIYALEILGANN